jgi:hypothetical protein
VLVRHLLEMSGSIIANVKPDGTDGGNLKLQAAKLIARDLYDYDEGKLLNASINFTGSKGVVLGNEYAGKYGMHDKAKTDHATVGHGNVKVNGEQLSAEQLHTRGVNSNVANAEETTRDEEVKPTKFVWTEYNQEKAEEIINARPFAERVKFGLQPLIDLAGKMTNRETFESKLNELKHKLPEKEQHIIDEALQKYQIGIENGLTDAQAAEVINQLYGRIEEKSSQDKKAVIKIVSPNKVGSEGARVLQDYYGDYENVPEEARDRIGKELPYIKDGNLYWTTSAEVDSKSSHQHFVNAGFKAERIILIASDLNQKYGTEAAVAMTAVSAMIGGVGSTAIATLKGVVGEQLVGEYIKQGIDYLVDNASSAIKKLDPYLSDSHARDLAIASLASGAVVAGTVKELLKSGSDRAVNTYWSQKPSWLFKNHELLKSHFDKHGASVAKSLGKESYTVRDYVFDANHVVKEGQYVNELNGYVKLIGGLGDKAKVAFVGITREDKHITTFHIKTVDEIIKKAPSLGWAK